MSGCTGARADGNTERFMLRALWSRTVEKRTLRNEKQVSGQEGHPMKELVEHTGVSRVGSQYPVFRAQCRA